MVKAAEIRKRVREAEAQRIKARTDAALDVATLHEKVAAARAALGSAETDLRRSVRAATATHGYSVAELANLTDVSAASLRGYLPDQSGTTTNGDSAAGHDERSDNS